MSYHSQFVLEFEDEIFNRVWDYWKSDLGLDVPIIPRPDYVWKTAYGTRVITYIDGVNHCACAYDISDFLERELGLDERDYYCYIRGEDYSMGDKMYNRPSKAGGLKPCWTPYEPDENPSGWFTEIRFNDDANPIPIQLSYRRDPAPPKTNLDEISDALNRIAELLEDVVNCLENQQR